MNLIITCNINYIEDFDTNIIIEIISIKFSFINMIFIQEQNQNLDDIINGLLYLENDFHEEDLIYKVIIYTLIQKN